MRHMVFSLVFVMLLSFAQKAKAVEFDLQYVNEPPAGCVEPDCPKAHIFSLLPEGVNAREENISGGHFSGDKHANDYNVGSNDNDLGQTVINAIPSINGQNARVAHVVNYCTNDGQVEETLFPEGSRRSVCEVTVPNCSFPSTRFGNQVILEFQDEDGETWMLRYAHLQNIPNNIVVGAEVNLGDTLGEIGLSGLVPSQTRINEANCGDALSIPTSHLHSALYYLGADNPTATADRVQIVNDNFPSESAAADFTADADELPDGGGNNKFGDNRDKEVNNSPRTASTMDLDTIVRGDVGRLFRRRRDSIDYYLVKIPRSAFGDQESALFAFEYEMSNKARIRIYESENGNISRRSRASASVVRRSQFNDNRKLQIRLDRPEEGQTKDIFIQIIRVRRLVSNYRIQFKKDSDDHANNVREATLIVMPEDTEQVFELVGETANFEADNDSFLVDVRRSHGIERGLEVEVIAENAANDLEIRAFKKISAVRGKLLGSSEDGRQFPPGDNPFVFATYDDTDEDGEEEFFLILKKINPQQVGGTYRLIINRQFAL